MEDLETEEVSTDSTDSKITSRKRLRQTTGSQTDEECDGDHWSEASVRLANLEAKMDKLLDLFSEIATLKVRLKTIEDENKDLKKAAENAKEELQELKPSVANLCMQQAEDSEEVQKLRKEVEQIKCRNIKLEAYTRRENIKIFNLKEKEGETPRETENLVRNMMEENLRIRREDMNEIRFERVHRLPTRHNSQTRTKPRPIIAKFSFYQDKEYVMSKVKNLKGTGIGISHDYPKEIDVIHEKLYPVLKKAKQEKQSAFFKVDKLIINGQVYRGAETEKLPYYGLIMNSTV